MTSRSANSGVVMTGLVLVNGDIPKFRKAHNERTS